MVPRPAPKIPASLKSMRAASSVCAARPTHSGDGPRKARHRRGDYGRRGVTEVGPDLEQRRCGNGQAPAYEINGPPTASSTTVATGPLGSRTGDTARAAAVVAGGGPRGRRRAAAFALRAATSRRIRPSPTPRCWLGAAAISDAGRPTAVSGTCAPTPHGRGAATREVGPCCHAPGRPRPDGRDAACSRASHGDQRSTEGRWGPARDRSGGCPGP